jgi:hypothetical protein
MKELILIIVNILQVMFRQLRLMQLGQMLTLINYSARNTKHKKNSKKQHPNQIVSEKDIRYNPWQ